MSAFLRMPAFIVKAKDDLVNVKDDLVKKKAREELLSYEKLLEKKILTQEEFDLKKDELKKVLLTKKIETNEPSETEIVQPKNDVSDESYEKALREIEEENLHKPSWARAISETEGDKTKAEALYIKLRVANITEELRQKEEKRLAEEEERRAEEKKRLVEEVERRVQNLLGRAIQEDYSGEKWVNFLRKHFEVLARFNLLDFVYDITKLRPLYRREDLTKWLMHCDEKWYVKTITAGPDASPLGHYGMLLIIALERGIDIQGAKQWGRP